MGTSKMARWFPRAGHVNDIKTSGPRQMVPLKSNKSLTKYPSSFPAQLSKDSNNTRSTYAIENIKHVPNHSREAVGPGHREDLFAVSPAKLKTCTEIANQSSRATAA